MTGDRVEAVALKPCPFCGGEAKLVGEAERFVRCAKCSAENIARLWNTRAGPSEADVEDIEQAFRASKLGDGDHASTCFEAGYRAAITALQGEQP